MSRPHQAPAASFSASGRSPDSHPSLTYDYYAENPDGAQWRRQETVSGW